MYPSASLCRLQQELQLKRAASATLDNVRSIAEKAAAAWGVEATAAEHRERRRAKVIQIREAGLRDLGPSENPDRGFADV